MQFLLRAYSEKSVDRVLSYQREFIWELARFRIWRSQFTSDIRFSVHICFLDQIFSLCYLFSRHAFYIIFDFHRDERCKLHTRCDDQRVERNKIVSIRDDCTFSARILRSISWRFHFQHEISLSIAMTMIHCFLHSRFLVLSFARLIDTRSNVLFRQMNCSSRYASKQNKIVKYARRDTRVVKENRQLLVEKTSRNKVFIARRSTRVFKKNRQITRRNTRVKKKSSVWNFLFENDDWISFSLCASWVSENDRESAIKRSSLFESDDWISFSFDASWVCENDRESTIMTINRWFSCSENQSAHRDERWKFYQLVNRRFSCFLESVSSSILEWCYDTRPD